MTETFKYMKGVITVQKGNILNMNLRYEDKIKNIGT